MTDGGYFQDTGPKEACLCTEGRPREARAPSGDRKLGARTRQRTKKDIVHRQKKTEDSSWGRRGRHRFVAIGIKREKWGEKSMR